MQGGFACGAARTARSELAGVGCHTGAWAAGGGGAARGPGHANHTAIKRTAPGRCMGRPASGSAQPRRTPSLAAGLVKLLTEDLGIPVAAFLKLGSQGRN